MTRRLAAVALAVAAACDSGGPAPAPAVAADVSPTAPANCDGSCATATTRLAQADVQQVIARAVAEAQARDRSATIAVVDRVGNVLAVFRMNTAATQVTIASQPPRVGGLEDVRVVPDTMAAITKALTGAYLSTEGNAFSTRTASQIVQDHFNPGELLQPGGPLFGVQFSQLPCSDLLVRFSGSGAGHGPHRSPLGLAADPGGFPLYLDGTVVGGVGVISDALYSFDRDPINDRDFDDDEFIALAATTGFEAPQARLASRITVEGKTLRYSDARYDELLSNPAAAPAFAGINIIAGQLVLVPGYFDGGNSGTDPLVINDRVVLAGVPFGTPASGIRPDNLDFAGLDAFVLVDASNTERFRPLAGTETSAALTASEVRVILQQALGVANRARAQIRRPLGSASRVTISVVDTRGTILGIVRSRDAPVFGIDVSLQKARTAAFFSSANAATTLAALPPAAYVDRTVLNPNAPGLRPPRALVSLAGYVTAVQQFLAVPTALTDGEFAFSDRAGGNLSRPFFPDGIDGSVHGPLSKPAGQWSPFSTGLQLDLVYNALINHVGFVAGLVPTDVPSNCTGIIGIDDSVNLFMQSGASTALANGIQIFPGSVPIYRGTVLVGGIGVSGDGVDQDDLVAFLGLHLAGQQLGSIGNAPPARRADQLTPMGTRLRYINCPQTPFVDSDEQHVCAGK